MLLHGVVLSFSIRFLLDEKQTEHFWQHGAFEFSLRVVFWYRVFAEQSEK